MVNLLKTFGKGILYIIGLPFFIVALVIFGVVGIFLFIFQLFKSIFYFFTGQKFFPELPEDKELRLRQEAAFAGANNSQPIDQEPVEEKEGAYVPPMLHEASLVEEPSFEEEASNNDNDYQSVEEACFKEEETSNEVFTELGRDEPEQSINLSESKIEEPKEEELEEYIPKGSTFVDDIDEEDTNSGGVDIDYDVR